VSNPILLMGVLATVAGMGAVWNIAGGTIYYKLVPDRLIGRVSSFGSLTAFGALPLGSLAGGILVQAYGPATTGLITGAAMLLLAASMTAVPTIRRGPAIAHS